jgi:hypothetical protein
LKSKKIITYFQLFAIKMFLLINQPNILFVKTAPPAKSHSLSTVPIMALFKAVFLFAKFALSLLIVNSVNKAILFQLILNLVNLKKIKIKLK